VTALLDASALLAILRGEPGSEAAVLHAADGGFVTAINFAEVRDQASRAYPDEPGAAASVDRFLDRRVTLVVCDESLARRASDLRAGHYRRRSRSVSLAACFVNAAAEGRRIPLVTSDADQAAVARSIGVEVLAIANSAGIVPDG